MRNYVINGRFRVREHGQNFHLHDGGAYVANRWWVGSGPGATSDVSFRKISPDRTSLRIEWRTVQTHGEDQYAPHPRYTFLEHHIHGSSELIEGPVAYSFAIKIDAESTPVIPVFWINWKNGNYKIFSMPQVVPKSKWTTFSGYWTPPKFEWDAIVTDDTFYVGFGLDLIEFTAPNLEMTDFRVWRPFARVDEHQIMLDTMTSR